MKNIFLICITLLFIFSCDLKGKNKSSETEDVIIAYEEDTEVEENVIVEENEKVVFKNGKISFDINGLEKL